MTKQVADDIGDVEKASDSAKESGTSFFGGMLQAASGFLLANVVGQITQQVGAFVSEGFSAARDTQQLMAQTETVIKNTGGAAGMSAQQVTDLATSLSDAAGQSLFGDDQIQGAENVLLKYKELKGIIPGVTKLSVDMAQSLGKDPAAAAEFLGRALQKPFDAANKLAKEGIVLTDSQKQTLEAFKKTGDTAGAQAFLMQQLNSTYAGSAQAAAQAAGGTVQFKARMGEVAENLATAALPLLDKLGGLLNDYVAPAIESFAALIGDLVAQFQSADEWSSSITETIATLTAQFIGFFTGVETGSDAFWTMQETLQSAFDLIEAGITALATYWTDTLQPALATVWQFIQDNVIPIIVTLVETDIAMLEVAITALAGFWVAVLWPALQKIWLFIRDNIIPILAALIVWIKDNLPPAIRALADLWNNVLYPALSAVWSFINVYLMPIFNAIVNLFNVTLKLAIEFIVGLMKTTLIPAFKDIYDYVNDSILPKLGDLGTFFYNTLGPAFSYLGTLISPVVQFFADLLDNVSGVATMLDTLARKISEIKMPSWAGGGGGASGGDSGGGGSSGGESSGSAPTGQSVTRTAGLRAASSAASSAPATTTVRIVFDAGAMQKLITATVEETLASSGQRSLSRMLTGN